MKEDGLESVEMFFPGWTVDKFVVEVKVNSFETGQDELHQPDILRTYGD